MEKELFTVTDVYEHAASIGKDIEQIVHDYGKEAIEEIMPKIVYVLEQLETLAERREEDQEKLASLMIEKEKYLIYFNRDQAIQRQLEEKLSYMEGLVNKDKRTMEKRIQRLEMDNDILIEELERLGGGASIPNLGLNNDLSKKRTSSTNRNNNNTNNSNTNGALPGDIEIMVRMKSTIDEQRNQIRLRNQEIQSQRNEIDALQEQVTRLGNINENLRTDSSVLSNESRTSSSHSNHSNHQHNTDVCDGGNNKNTPNLNVSSTSLLDELRHEDASFTEIDDRDIDDAVNDTSNSSFADLTSSICLTSDEIVQNSKANSTNSTENGSTSTLSATDDSGLGGSDAPLKPPRKDPDRPRYTLAEMQSLLEERNTYKIKMMALEEELELYTGGRPNVLKTTQSAPVNVNVATPPKPSGVRTFMQKFLGK